MYPEFIHYGHDKFDKNLFIPIINVDFVKPVGGLWASPINSRCSWKDWCVSKDFHLPSLNRSFRFKLKNGSRIFVIGDKKSLYFLPIYKDSYVLGSIYNLSLDFELISKSYDALWLTDKGKKATDNPMEYLNLCGWDCESLLVLNPNIIIINYGKNKSC